MIWQFDMHNPLYDMASVIFYKNVAIHNGLSMPENLKMLGLVP